MSSNILWVYGKEHPMDAQLRELWVESGCPGVAKLFAAAKRKGLDVKRATVDAFVKSQETRQIFAPAPTSKGKVTANSIDDRWQIDLIDYKQMDISANKGYRNVMVAVDVFSRFAWAVPMQDKTQEATISAFRSILGQSRRKPAEVDSDAGHE
ncbi:MAG: transposase family protein, partial [Propionibacteriaceae bacterium]|nr:transposase family protein [Propionibacteriaceae bacterium]